MYHLYFTSPKILGGTASAQKCLTNLTANYFTASHFWLATVQEVLQADWQEDWQLPQPPLAAVDLRSALLIVVMCFKRNTSFFECSLLWGIALLLTV